MNSKSLLHTRWKCQYHIEFIPKYRKKKLFGQLRIDVREILSTLCKHKGVEIIEGAVCVDHVHMCVSIPPKIRISNFMGYLKGKGTLMIYDMHPEQQSKRNKAFWARGYYVATVGNATGVSLIPLKIRVGRAATMKDNPTMQDALRQFYPRYLDLYAPNARQAKAAHHILNCETGAYGATISKCGGYENMGLHFVEIRC